MRIQDDALSDWLDYLENRYQHEIQLGLSRVKKVAMDLNILHWTVPVIIVAGTNGKGSTMAMLEAIYMAAGYNVASYTSPHLFAFNERIRLNNVPITDKALCRLFTLIEATRGETPLTYFEMATLAALCYFNTHLPDVLLLEVGMGGRLDATNIIDADLAIITTIDLDHQTHLGYTKEAIAIEKAGVLRPGCPWIYADEDPPASLLKIARALKAPKYQWGEAYWANNDGASVILGRSWEQPVELPCPRINTKAAISAIIASDMLYKRLPVSIEDWKKAMQDAFIVGRQHVLVIDGITTVFDVAHNPQAVALLATFMKRYALKRIHAVFSGLSDKDLCGLIKPMRAYVKAWYPALLKGKRAASQACLLNAFQEAACPIEQCFMDPVVAYEASRQSLQPGDIVVVYGSFLTVQAVMNAKRKGARDEICNG